MTPEDLMQLAIKKCRDGIKIGQSPFGCAIADGNQVISVAHNTVVLTTDITAHAEVNAIRLGCQHTGNILLEDAIVATTCEPCPMCMAALHWARVKTVYYGATIQDADEGGFNELALPASDLIRLGGSNVDLVGPILQKECQQLFTEWKSNPNRVTY